MGAGGRRHRRCRRAAGGDCADRDAGRRLASHRDGRRSGGGPMTLSRGILIYAGVALVLVAMIYGLLYAVLVEHQQLDAMGGALAGSFVAAAEREPAQADPAMRRYADTNYAYVRQVDVHSHWSGLGLLLV